MSKHLVFYWVCNTCPVSLPITDIIIWSVDQNYKGTACTACTDLTCRMGNRHTQWKLPPRVHWSWYQPWFAPDLPQYCTQIYLQWRKPDSYSRLCDLRPLHLRIPFIIWLAIIDIILTKTCTYPSILRPPSMYGHIFMAERLSVTSPL